LTRVSWGRCQEHASDAEVEQLDQRPRPGGALPDHVRWLDVAVHQPRRVDHAERREQLGGHLHRLLDGQRGGALEVVVEQLAVDQLHHQVGQPRVGQQAEVEHADDVLVVDRARGPRLVKEARADPAVRRRLGQHLDR
jgi:hypothetical protein